MNKSNVHMISTGKIFAAALACLLVIIIAFGVWPRWRHTIDVRVTDLRQTTSGVLVATVVLTNGTPRTFNVLDDADGKPLFLLDDDSVGWPPGSGSYGLWLGVIGNMHRVNLAPGASLTHTLALTNPPPRFRLRVNVLDLTTAGEGLPLHRILGKTAAMEVFKWRQRRNADLLLPASVWIERGDLEKSPGVH